MSSTINTDLMPPNDENSANCDIVVDTLSTSGDSQSDRLSQFSPLQFLDRSELLIKLSRIIFEDFYANLLTPISEDEELRSDKNTLFLAMLRKFIEICECGVKGIEKVCADFLHKDPNSKILLDQLTLERAAYCLMIRIYDSEKLLKDNQNLVSTSVLTKLFREDEQFRRLSTLLLWNEECSQFSLTDFSRITNDDAVKLSEVENIYACTKLRGPIHIDSRFADRIAAEDEEAILTLNRVLFSLLRSGRLDEAKSLLDNVGLPVLSSFILIREFLIDQKLSPLDRFDNNSTLAQSRLYFKQMARELIPLEGGGRIQQTDHCFWATIGGHLPTLLAYVKCTEDRLWSLLSCAIESLLDNALSSLHANIDGNIGLVAADLRRENDDLPMDIHSIFQLIRNSDSSPYYALFGYLALEQWEEAAYFIDSYLRNSQSQITAHELRFFIHLILLLKITDRLPSKFSNVIDNLIERYTAILTQMKLNALIPLYLFHLSGSEQPKNQMLDFLENITFEPEQNEVLESAQNVGFDLPPLCVELFQRYKRKYRIGGNSKEDNSHNSTYQQQLAKSTDKLLHAWKWLTFCGSETIWDAIIEANYLLRKFFLHNRMEEAMELMKMIPETLSNDAIDSFHEKYPDSQIPATLSDAKYELDCYRLYFEAIGRYEEWQKLMEGEQVPELPPKLSDERWARLDTRRRGEYELSVKRARDCLQKYYRLVELYKKRAVELLEHVLKMADGWLVTLPLEDDDSSDPKLLERANDFVEIRKNYLASLVELIVDIHTRSDEPLRVLEVGQMLVDPSLHLYKSLTKEKLQKLFVQVSKSGAALL